MPDLTKGFFGPHSWAPRSSPSFPWGSPYFTTPMTAWRVLDFHGNPFNEDVLEGPRIKIKKGSLVVRDHEHPSADYFVADGVSVDDPNLPMPAKVSCLVDVLKKGGSYGLWRICGPSLF